MQRSQQHITLTTYSRNREGFAVQRVANSSLAEASQCIYDDPLGLKSQQETFIAKKIDWHSLQGGGLKKGKFKLLQSTGRIKRAVCSSGAPQIFIDLERQHSPASIFSYFKDKDWYHLEAWGSKETPENPTAIAEGDRTYIRHPHSVLGGSSLSCLVLPTSNNNF